MRYCKYVATEDGTNLPRYALVEQRVGVLWATLPMQAPQEDLVARPYAPLATNFRPTLLRDLHLLPPVTPSKIVCVGRNYRDHAAELGNDVPRTSPLPQATLVPARLPWHRLHARRLPAHRLRGRTRHRHRPPLPQHRP
jgi:2-keto-4-pentenoate hydratase/2-oxohepta-3-ene-1,7-dioic acid hydratase in catechol pathway